MKFDRLFLAVVLVVSGVLTVRAAEVELPDTPAGKQAQALLEMLASGERSAVATFTKQNFAKSFLQAIPLERHVEVNMAFAERTGGIIPQHILSSSETKLRFAGPARNAHSRWQVGIEVETDPPHKIVSLGFMRPQPWSQVTVPPVPAGSLTLDQLTAYLNEYLTALAKADAFSGATLLAKGDDIIFDAAYGPASRAWNVPNRTDTKFNLGSMNKMFTSVAVAQLVEQGKLALDDFIAKHLPDYPNQNVARQVTVRNLLNHTSGLRSYFNDKFMNASRDQFRKVEDYLPLFVDEPLQFEPGTRYSYSNAGFVVLGLLIEQVSGKDYFEYVRKHIYQPAGMSHTDCYELDLDTPNLAVGYTREETEGQGQWRNNLFIHVFKGGPAGGGYSTVEDLFRFAQALKQGKLIKAETLDLWTQPGERNPSYGLGFEIYDASGQRAFGHRGGFPGISGWLQIDRNTAYTIVVLSNIDSGTLPVSDKLGELAPKLKSNAPPAEAR